MMLGDFEVTAFERVSHDPDIANRNASLVTRYVSGSWP
jgi:hypothetical protein